MFIKANMLTKHIIFQCDSVGALGPSISQGL